MSSEPPHKRVLIAGATGRLGVIIDVLLARGHSVRAMTRNPTSPAAGRLRAAGVDVVNGDFDDPGSLVAAATGADAMFATGTAHRAGPDGELRHGRNLADAAALAGIPHLVYTSGDGAAPDSQLGLFRVKHQVEQHIRSLAVPHTILAPVYFMENLFNPWNLPLLQAGAFPSPIPVELPMQQVAIADLARLAAIAVERPDEFAGLRITVASDELSAEHAAHVLARGSSAASSPLRGSQVRSSSPVCALYSPGSNTTGRALILPRCTIAIRKSVGTTTRPGRALSMQGCGDSAHVSTQALDRREGVIGTLGTPPVPARPASRC